MSRAKLTPPLTFTGLMSRDLKPVFVDRTGVFVTDPRPEDRITFPSAITLLGYACSLAALAGVAPMWVGVLGLLADEIDGRVARSTGQVSRYGGELDYAADLTLTGLTAVKALGPVGYAVLPLITAVQAYNRANNQRPALGSARAAFTVLGMVR